MRSSTEDQGWWASVAMQEGDTDWVCPGASCRRSQFPHTDPPLIDPVVQANHDDPMAQAVQVETLVSELCSLVVSVRTNKEVQRYARLFPPP